MKDRNSSNLSVELCDNQGATKAAQALRDSSLVRSLNKHNKGCIWVVASASLLLLFCSLSQLMIDFFLH